MATKGLHRLTVQESVAPYHRGHDRHGDYASLPWAYGATAAPASATAAFGATKAIYVNLAGTYEITFESGQVVDMILAVSTLYPFAAINVLNTSSAAIDAADVTLLY